MSFETNWKFGIELPVQVGGFLLVGENHFGFTNAGVV